MSHDPCVVAKIPTDHEPMKPYAVRAARCDHRASDEIIYSTLRQITEPLTRAWTRLEAARTILIKTNMVWPPEKLRHYAGRRQEHVDDAVFRAVLRLLRERTRARLIVPDTTLVGGGRPGRDVNFLPLLAEFGAEYIECSEAPVRWFDVPGGGILFGRYLMNGCLAEADAAVSVAKMKNHGFAGITMTVKNLFGLCPLPPLGRPRSYFHHLVRLPCFLADFGQLVNPCLNVVDGLVGQARREWGGEPRIGDALLAGDHPVATDVCGAWLMGHDPAADWPTPPYRRDRSTVRQAAEHGFGTLDLNQIDFATDLTPPVAEFDSEQTDPLERVGKWLCSTCEQALFFRDHQRDLSARYANEFIFLQDREVVWHGPDPHHLGSRRALSGARPDSALWLKFVDPDETEQEHFELYERALPYFAAQLRQHASTP
jgi:uncharacterized protein (DUF362 family)